ncbi:hypothetical protein [Achromobacter xylosoxidans]|uniref:hypothetical protein n=1 Tax=Alcaligenes xylosoxydans xylosoxydans TaxID=85698 RepID=UPI001F0CF842|nr:hypothetical protein [Achromobacter xylosoxidans]MCH4572214.1 hypothetical protein [Achromobacter xylosoxidans]
MTHARKPRRKQYRPRPARLPMLIKAQQTLAPLEAIIDQIDRIGAGLTQADASDLLRQTQILAEMDAARAQGA